MFKPKEGEKIIISLHRHWFVIASKMTAIAILLLVAAVALPIIISVSPPEFVVLFLFATSVYVLIVLLLAFIFWVDYYLDIWIITDRRLVDMEQKGLFQREISEFELDKVQDVTVEVPNFFATVLEFGNIIVQTAGERSFKARDIPHPTKAKDIIMEQIRKSKPL